MFKMNKIIILLFVVVSFKSFAQISNNEAKGNKLYNNFTFNKAIDKLEKVKIEELSTKGLRNLANSYKYLHNIVKAEEYYSVLVTREDNNPEDLLMYAEMLEMNKKYPEAEKWMSNFHAKLKEDSRGEEFVSKKGEYKKLEVDNNQFKIFNLDINTDKEDFGVSYYQNKVVFASSRKHTLPFKHIWNWNNFPFLNLYEGDISSNSKIVNVKRLSKEVNKKYHEGPASFSEDGNLMVFTRNNYDEKSSNGETKLTMFYREKNDEGEWKEIIPFKFNNKEYSVGHPALTPDGKTLYFVSDMPGGIGETDLYKIERVNNEWTIPVNLGKEINTEGKEMFPFYHQDGVLFFASEGHVGLGGLDIFVSKVGGDGSFSEVKNLGYPLNDSKDDFALVLDSNQQHGFFSSNRDGGKGSDDIYAFNLLKPLKFCKEIKGITLDNENNILSSVTVFLLNDLGETIEEVSSNEKGEYSFCVQPGNYKLKGTLAKYFDGDNKAIVSEESNEEVNANVILEKDPGFGLLVNITDAKTGNNIEGVNVSFSDNIEKLTSNKISDIKGDSKLPLKGVRLNEGVSYTITLSKEGYLPKTISYNEKLTKPGVQKITAQLQQIPNFSLYALITDAKTDSALSNVELTIVDNITNKQESFITPITGDISQAILNRNLNDNISYRFILKKEGYLTKEVTYNKKLTREGVYEAHLELDFTMEPLLVGGDLSKLIDINPINFDLNKYNIRPDAQVELDKIVKVMNEYPSMWIELGAHTDCRGSKKYNEALSDKRAKSSAEYIASKITNPERIYGKGYGEEKLLNHCECEGSRIVPCTNEEHDVNRRTEFRIVKFEAQGVKAKANGPNSFE